MAIHPGYSSPLEREVEVVERKGIGHPDTICDALAEEICRALCQAYLREFGQILHHNVDKILLCGGAAQPRFGGGEVLEPLELYLGGRVTVEHAGRRIPVAEIAAQACRSWLGANLPQLDLEHHVRIIPKFRPGSGALQSVFARGQSIPLSNDTSCGAGFAPLTPLERVVLEVEKTLNRAETKTRHPAIGQDVKVMGIRHGSRIRLTISCAMIDGYLAGLSDYVAAKTAVSDLALASARRITGLDVHAEVNVADNLAGGDVFLTVTGTSAEAGDDGETGRGNRVCGLITPGRPMTLEAAAGKNPVTHVGKLYNLAAARLAGRIVRDIEPVNGASCLMVSQIGRRVDDPQAVDVCVAAHSELETAKPAVRAIVLDELQHLDRLRTDLLTGAVAVY